MAERLVSNWWSKPLRIAACHVLPRVLKSWQKGPFRGHLIMAHVHMVVPVAVHHAGVFAFLIMPGFISSALAIDGTTIAIVAKAAKP